MQGVFAWFMHWSMLRRQNAGTRRRHLEALWRGDVEQARAQLGAPRSPVAKFQRACIELEAGAFDASHQWAEQLPDDPAATVLRALIAGRRAAPDAPWLRAFEDAWRGTGAPSQRASRLLDADVMSSIDRGTGDGLDPTTHALWLRMTFRASFLRRKPALRDWATGFATFDVPELVVAAALFDPALRPAIIARLAELVPTSFWVRCAQFSLATGSLGDADLEQLAHVLDAADGDALVAPDALYTRLTAAATAAGSRAPEVLALLGAYPSLVVPNPTLLQRLPQTPDAIRREAAGLYVRLGRRMRQDRYAMTYIYGAAFLRQANAVLGDPDLAAEGNHQTLEHQLLFQERAPPWPLPSLLRERAVAWRDEIAMTRRFPDA